MRWMLEVAYIGVITSWKWLLGSTAVIAVLVGTLFAVGVLGGGEEGATGATPQAASPTPTPAAGPDPGLRPQVLSPTPTPQPTVVTAAKFISIPILATRAKNVGSLEFVLVYDPAKLEFAQLERGLLAGDALIDSSPPGPGRLWAGIIDINGVDGRGPVAIGKFNVGDNAGGPRRRLWRCTGRRGLVLSRFLLPDPEPPVRSVLPRGSSLQRGGLAFAA